MITKEIEAAIITALHDGQTPGQIRLTLGVSLWIIRRVRKKAGLAPLRGQGENSRSVERQEQAMELRRQGFSLDEIGVRLNPPVTGKRVHQLLKGTGAQFACAQCGKPSQRLHFFHEDCTPFGAKGICPGCAEKVGKNSIASQRAAQEKTAAARREAGKAGWAKRVEQFNKQQQQVQQS